MLIAPARIAAFRDLHAEGRFTIPNPYDAGSARLLAALAVARPHAAATAFSPQA